MNYKTFITILAMQIGWCIGGLIGISIYDGAERLIWYLTPKPHVEIHITSMQWNSNTAALFATNNK